MWHIDQRQLGEVRPRLACLHTSQEAFFSIYSILLSKELKERRKHIFETHAKRLQDRKRWVKRQTGGKMVCLLFSEEPLKEVSGVGWELVVEGGGLHHKSGVPPWSGTCKSGERRTGTQPNDSSTVLYKYCCTGSARLLLLVAKKPRDTGVSPSERKVFNNPLIFFSPSQTCRWTTHYLLPLSGREAGRKGI